uniref:Uncharacterized protein n=1 Tax=Strongyloides venezuelensis TaxID=75913 RepID=A0A0K0FFG5_STRVS
MNFNLFLYIHILSLVGFVLCGWFDDDDWVFPTTVCPFLWFCPPIPDFLRGSTISYGGDYGLDHDHKRKKRDISSSKEIIGDNLEKRSANLKGSREQRLYYLKSYYR